MSRRRYQRQDSLELLLDTICNTFGGVLFIAILVVLLLQQSGGIPKNDSTPAQVSPVELQLLANRMESVAADLTRLRNNRDSQLAVVKDFAPETIREQIVRRHEVTAKQENLQVAIDKLLADAAVLAGRVEQLDATNDSARTDLERALERLKQAQLKLDSERQARVQEVRMPVIRSVAGKQEIGLVVRYGRVYVWHRYGPGYQRLGLNTDDFVILTEEDGGLATRPKPTGGVVLTGGNGSQMAVRQTLRRFDPKSCYLAIIVRPDSYSDFHHLRDRAIELGFEYRLIPVDDETPIADRGGNGGHVQ